MVVPWVLNSVAVFIGLDITAILHVTLYDHNPRCESRPVHAPYFTLKSFPPARYRSEKIVKRFSLDCESGITLQSIIPYTKSSRPHLHEVRRETPGALLSCVDND